MPSTTVRLLRPFQCVFSSFCSRERLLHLIAGRYFLSLIIFSLLLFFPFIFVSSSFSPSLLLHNNLLDIYSGENKSGRSCNHFISSSTFIFSRLFSYSLPVLCSLVLFLVVYLLSVLSVPTSLCLFCVVRLSFLFFPLHLEHPVPASFCSFPHTISSRPHLFTIRHSPSQSSSKAQWTILSGVCLMSTPVTSTTTSI